MFLSSSFESGSGMEMEIRMNRDTRRQQSNKSNQATHTWICIIRCSRVFKRTSVCPYVGALKTRKVIRRIIIQNWKKKKNGWIVQILTVWVSHVVWRAMKQEQ